MIEFRKILLFILLSVTIIPVQAQTASDSLCRKIDFTDIRFTGYKEYNLGFESFGYAKISDLNYKNLNLRFDFVTDMTKPMDRIYLENAGKEYPAMNGRYNISMQQYVGGGYVHIVGVNMSYANIYKLNNLIFNVYACFIEGLPSCTWRTLITWNKNSQKEEENPDVIFLDQTFKDGLLDGIFRVLHNGKDIYRTTFVDGSGYYKAYLPNGKVCSQGDIIKGLPHGTWMYFSYDKNGQCSMTNIIDYEMGKPINNTPYQLKNK